MRRSMGWLLPLVLALAIMAALVPGPPPPPVSHLAAERLWATLAHLDRAYVATGVVDSSVLTAASIAALAAAVDADPDEVAGAAAAMDGQPPAEVPGAYADVWRALELLADEALTAAPDEVEIALLQAMVAAIGDPRSRLLIGVEASAGEEYDDDAFQGIGALVAERDGDLVISLPFPGGPADQAGVRSGDVVVEVDGLPVEGQSLAEVVDRVRGPEHSTVHLHLRRDGFGDLEVTVRREQFDLATASFQLMPDQIGYLAVTRLTESTPDEVARDLELLAAQGIRGLILDLRGNPGGRRSAATAVAGQFLEGGIVYYEEHLDGSELVRRAPAAGLTLTTPLVVLIDGGTAGAAEILAAALRERGRGGLVGARTAGDGLVHGAQPIDDDLALLVLLGQWRTPLRNSVQGSGLTPDLEVPLTGDDIALGQDRQLLAAYGALWTTLSAQSEQRAVGG